MVDRSHNSHMIKELEQEAALLKSIKDKLVDQLQRLKVEELALVNYISMGNSANSTYAGSSSTGSYFSSTRQGSTDTIEMNEDINSMPLVDLSKGLASNSRISSAQLVMDQEEEEEDED